MTAQDSLNIPLQDQSQLQHLSNLLHLFHHRNKNQHRHSLWWRPFSLFRKQLSHLTSAIIQLNSTPQTNLARTKKKTQDAKIISTHTERMTFWRDVMVPKWQHSFSQLIADGRFSVLGLVLMAALAQVCLIVGITAELEDLGQGEVERVLEEFGREWDVGDAVRGIGEDVGEVVRREEDEPSESLATSAKAQSSAKALSGREVQMKPSKKRSLEGVGKRTKKKRKKGDAIDDIFG